MHYFKLVLINLFEKTESHQRVDNNQQKTNIGW